VKRILLLIILFFPFAVVAQQKPQPKKKPPVKYWEEFTEKEKQSVIADSISSKEITDLYNGKFSFSDPGSNVALFNSLVSPSGSIVALRIYLFTKLIIAGDTSIGKLLQEYSVRMAYNQPDMLLRFFTFEHAKKNDVYKKYIPWFASDLDEAVEFQNFKDFLDLYFIRGNAAIKQMLLFIYKESEKAGAGSNHPVPIPLPPRGKDD
jgi:hypothetical protein